MNLTGLPLFAPPASEHPAVKAVHDRHRSEHADWLARLRQVFARLYGGTRLPVSTDEVWLTMRRNGIELPAGASPNILGSFFSGWERAPPVGWTRSRRAGAHANLIRTWQIE